MKALSANYFLKAFLQTFPMAYYTCPGHKNFTFQLPGKCVALMSSSNEFCLLSCDPHLTFTWPGPGPELDKNMQTGNFVSGELVRVRQWKIYQIFTSSPGLLSLPTGYTGETGPHSALIDTTSCPLEANIQRLVIIVQWLWSGGQDTMPVLTLHSNNTW